MTVQTLTKTLLTADAAATDITAALVAATQTTVQFPADQNTVLAVVSTAGTTTTVTLNIGTTVLGNAVASPSATTIAVINHVYLFGPFHTAVYQTGTNLIQVTLSATTNILLGAIDLPGVY